MAKPVSGSISYDPTIDRPTAELRSGTKYLLTEDDAGGGGSISQVSGTGAIDTANPTGPVVTVSLDKTELENGGSQELNLAGMSGLTAADVGAVPTARTITAGTGLTGGGDLSANRSLAADFGSGAGKVTQGNDSRLSDARTPTGAAGGDLSGTYPNPTIVNVPQIKSNHWALPPSAHANDQEFDSTTLPANWKLWLFGVTTTDETANIQSGVDWMTNPAAGKCRIEANRTRRKSWLLLQPEAVAGGPNWFYGFQMSFVTTNQYVFRSRLTNLVGQAPGNNSGNMKLAILEEVAGVPVTTSRIHCGLEVDASSGFYTFGDNASPNMGTSPTNTYLYPPSLTEVALLFKGSGTVNSFGYAGGALELGGRSGTLPWGTGTKTVWVGFFFTSAAAPGTNRGACILGADYFRQQDDNDYLG